MIGAGRLACAAAALAGCGDATPHAVAAEPVRTAKVARGELADRELLTGELRAATSVALTVPRTDSWQLAIRWLADDGAQVKAGDKVLEFDNSAFTAQREEKQLALIEAEMTLRGARDLSSIETAAKDNELRQRRIALDRATLRAGVPADLLAGREAQERQLEQKRAEVAVQKAALEVAAQRQQAALDLQVKQIALDKARTAIEVAERTIKELVLTSPRDGLIVVEDHPWLGRKIRTGDTVQPGMPVLSLPDLGAPMEVHGELSDVDDGRVAVGMSGTCTLDAFPRDPIACTVAELTPVARTKGESSLRRAFAIELTLAKTDAARMRPGMSVKIELRPRAAPGGIVVPRGAITRDASRPSAVKVQLASGEQRDVTLGACDAQVCAVAAGLAEGDTVQLGDAP